MRKSSGIVGFVIATLAVLLGLIVRRWQWGLLPLSLNLSPSPPLVTVIVPCYNVKEEWFFEMLSSLEAQSMRDFETILLDDGSSTGPLADLFKDKSIFCSLFPECTVVSPSGSLHLRLARHRNNLGLAAARNTGAMLAKGQFLVFLDPDDWIAPTALEQMLLHMRALQHYPDRRIAFVYPSTVHFHQGRRHQPIRIDRVHWDGVRLRKANYIPSFALIPRQLYLGVGGMCEQAIRYYEDYDFWLRLASLGYRGALLDQPLFFYRRHTAGRTATITHLDREAAWRGELRVNNPIIFGNLILDHGESGGIESSSLALEGALNNLVCYRQRRDGILLAWLRLLTGVHATILATTRLSPAYLSSPTIDLKRLPIHIHGRTSCVLFIIPWMQIGGADYYDLAIIRALSQHSSKNYHLVIVTDLHDSSHPLRTEFERYADEIFHLRSLVPAGWEEGVVAEQLDHFVRTRQPRLVYIRNSHNGYRLCRRWASQVSFMDVQHLSTNTDTLGWEYTTRSLHSLMRLRLVVSRTLEGRVKKLLLQWHQRQEQRQGKNGPNTSPILHLDSIAVLPPPVDTQNVWNRKALLATVETVKSCKHRTVAFVGRLEEQKDPLAWLRIAAQLASEFDDLLFLMIGEGPLRDQVLQLARTLSALQGRLMHLPFQSPSDLARYLLLGLARDQFGMLGRGTCPHSCLLLSSSRNEGLPMVLLEAVAIGTPVLAPPVGAVVEVAEEMRGQKLVHVATAPNETALLALARTLLIHEWSRNVSQEGETELPLHYHRHWFEARVLELFAQHGKDDKR